MPDALPFAATGGDASGVFLELGLVVAILALLARLAVRSGFSPIPLYLLAGLVLGALDPIELSARFIEVGAQLGVVLLLFALGLEYTGEELVANLRSSARVGALDLGLNFAPGFLAGIIMGWGAVPALLLGGVTVISSSGIVAKVLTDLGRLGNRETPAILSILVIEDLALAFYLPFVAVLLTGAGVVAATGSIAIAVGAALGTLVVAIRLGPLLSRVVFSRSDEVLLLSVLGIVLLVSGAAEGLNVSAAVGAFLVGIAVSGQVASRTAELVAPLRDLFAAVFFVFFGLQIDVGELPGVALAAAALAVVTSATKLVTGWWAAKRAGVGVRGRLRAGTGLVARGEFSIVIAGLGVAAGVEGSLGPLAAAYVLMLAIAGPVLARYADHLEPLVSRGRRRAART
ncbi:MAG: cation:proton antiporter [Gaiellales bacterium]